MSDKDAAVELKNRTKDLEIKILAGEDSAAELAESAPSSTLLNAIIGFAGLVPTVKAVESGKNIAIANKETLVSAGELIMPLVKKHGVNILPVTRTLRASSVHSDDGQKKYPKAYYHRLRRTVFRLYKRAA